MRKMHKILSVCMAVVMLFTVLTTVASALTYEPSLNSGEIKFIMRADKTEVKPGDTVAVSLYINPGSFSDFGPPQFVISYNGSQLSPVATVNTEFREYQNEMGSRVSNTATVSFTLPTTGANGAMTSEEKAYYTNAIMLSGQFISGVYPNVVGGGWTPNPENSQMTFYMKVADDVQPGDEIWVGLHNSSFVRNMAFVSQAGGNRIPVSNYDLSESMVKLTVASDEPVVTGPAVIKTQAEVKMTLNEDKTAVDYAAAPFQFRVISSISEDDWNTYFKGDGSNIESVGFVAYKGDGAFDMETAKSVAMGGSAADYQAAKTDYIQKVDGQPANFGARIDFTARENVKDVTYIAFVQYDTDRFAFYDTSFDADLNSNYDKIVSRYAEFIAG